MPPSKKRRYINSCQTVVDNVEKAVKAISASEDDKKLKLGSLQGLQVKCSQCIDTLNDWILEGDDGDEAKGAAPMLGKLRKEKARLDAFANILSSLTPHGGHRVSHDLIRAAMVEALHPCGGRVPRSFLMAVVKASVEAGLHDGSDFSFPCSVISTKEPSDKDVNYFLVTDGNPDPSHAMVSEAQANAAREAIRVIVERPHEG